MLTATDVIQLAAVLVAAAAAIVALAIATIDRKTQLRIARHQARLSRLTVELEYAVRLSANNTRGGSTDALERAQLGAEAAALVSVVGARWAPLQYAEKMSNQTPTELRAKLDDDESETPTWVKWKIESALAVQAIVDELHTDLDDRPTRSSRQ
jgi:hypothetical protein